MKKSNQILKNFIISYCTVLIIPLLLFGNIIYSHSKDILIKNIISSYKTSSQNVDEKVFHISSQAMTVASIIEKNKYFFSPIISDFGGSFVYIDETLKNLHSTNDFFDDIVFYNSITEKIYSKSIYSSSYYFSNIFVNESKSTDEYMKLLKYSLSPKWVKMSSARYFDNNTFITSLIYPIERTYKNGAPYLNSCVIFHINYEQICSLLSPLLTVKDSKAIVLLNGEPIFSSDYHIVSDLDSIENEIKKNSKDYFISTLDSRKYVVISYQTPNSPTKIISFIPYNYISENSKGILYVYIISFLICISLGIVVIAIATKFNYSPIQKLYKSIRNSIFTIPNTLNEFESAFYVFENLIDNNRTIANRNLQFMRERLLLKLINSSSTFACSTDFKKMCEDYEINFFFKYHQCFILGLNGGFLDSDKLVNIDFTKYLKDNVLIYFAEYFENDCVIFVLSSNTDNNSICTEFISTLMKIYYKDISYNIGIGEFVTDISEISKSYRQAFSSLISSDTIGKNIVYYKDIGIFSPQSITSFNKEVNSLYKSIISFDKDKIILSSNNIIEMLQDNSDTSVGIMVIYNIIHHCIGAFEFLNLNDTAFLYAHINTLSTTLCSDISQLIPIIKNIVNNILLIFDSINKKSTINISLQDKNIEDIVLFINRNFKDENFSVKLIADNFNISVSNLSHFFKSKMQINISDYINNLKMDTARKLLHETDMPISQIVQEIGYTNTSSFIKKFKKIESMTPGEYRKST